MTETGTEPDYLRVGCVLVSLEAKDRTLGTFHPKLCGITVQRTGYIFADYVIIIRIDIFGISVCHRPQDLHICTLRALGTWLTAAATDSGFFVNLLLAFSIALSFSSHAFLKKSSNNGPLEESTFGALSLLEPKKAYAQDKRYACLASVLGPKLFFPVGVPRMSVAFSYYKGTEFSELAKL